MATVDRNNQVIQVLLNLFNRTTNNGSTNDEITRGEVRRYLADRFDVNRNGAIDNGENAAGTLLEQMTVVDLNTVTGLNENERKQLQRAQELLKSVVQEKLVPPAPTQDIRGTTLEYAPLIVDPHELADPTAMDRWSNMRSGFEGQTINVNVGAARENINQILSTNNGNVGALVKALWTNGDSVGETPTNVVRMTELIGAWKHSETDPNFRQQFIQEMANYVANPNNGLDQQFVLDSLLQVIQSTDFTGQESLEKFLKDLAIGIANSGQFAGKQGVIGNYDGTREGGVFGSLALVKNADGSFEFIEHDPASGKKTRYNLNEGLPAPGGLSAAAPTLPSAAPQADGAETTSPSNVGETTRSPQELQRALNEIEGQLNDVLEKIIDPGDRSRFEEAQRALSGIEIPSIVANPEALGSLIANLETLQQIALTREDVELATKIGGLIAALEALKAKAESTPPSPIDTLPIGEDDQKLLQLVQGLNRTLQDFQGAVSSSGDRGIQAFSPAINKLAEYLGDTSTTPNTRLLREAAGLIDDVVENNTFLHAQQEESFRNIAHNIRHAANGIDEAIEALGIQTPIAGESGVAPGPIEGVVPPPRRSGPTDQEILQSTDDVINSIRGQVDRVQNNPYAANMQEEINGLNKISTVLSELIRGEKPFNSETLINIIAEVRNVATGVNAKSDDPEIEVGSLLEITEQLQNMADELRVHELIVELDLGRNADGTYNRHTHGYEGKYIIYKDNDGEIKVFFGGGIRKKDDGSTIAVEPHIFENREWNSENVTSPTAQQIILS